MAAPRSLEVWATERLEAMGVDGVFAPYVIGMLGGRAAEGTGAGEDDDDEIHFSVHEVLMGWLSPEDEERAQEFVVELLKYHRNPMLVPAASNAPLDMAARDLVQTGIGYDGDIESEREMELKASAPLFVPGSASSFHEDTHGDDMALVASSVLANTVNTDEEEASALNEAAEPPVDDLQDEDTFFWSVAYDLVGHLQLKFPEVDPTRLCELLKLVELDADKAHAVIKATLEREAMGTMQVCRHYLAGDCRRADCMFVHDTHVITCRFWFRGACLQAENCVFAHDFAEFYTVGSNSNINRDYDSEDEQDGDDGAAALNFQAEEMFPSLQSGAGSNGANDAAVSNLSMNFARAVAIEPSASSWGGNAPRRPAPASMPPSVPMPRRPLYHKTAEAVAGEHWLTTGEAVTVQYTQLREEAYELACARNRCFMNATRAYQNGNKSLARSLSSQGHGYNEKMKRKHFQAAARIFESRNPKRQLYNDHIMDLHGLHVAEAVEFLGYMLPQLADDGLTSIYLVTGSGHHSKGATGNARLLPAVERFLATDGYQYSPVADRRGFVGMLMVDLRW